MPWYFETMCLHSVPSRMKWHDTVLCCTVGCGVCPHVITILCYCVMLCYCAVQLGVVCVSTCYHHIYDRGDKKMTEAGASSQHGPSALALTHTNVPNVIYKHQCTQCNIQTPLKETQTTLYACYSFMGIHEGGLLRVIKHSPVMKSSIVLALVFSLPYMETSTLWQVRRACADERSRQAIYSLPCGVFYSVAC